MLGTIFKFETKRWLKSWLFYLFFVIFFALSFSIIASVLGYFDVYTAKTSSNIIVNYPIAINGIINEITKFVNFIIPAVIGSTVYRDYKYNSHTLLFAYPF